MHWATVELLGYTYYSELGYKILTPLVKQYGYDFVAEKDGEFLRVNVKLAGLKDKTVKNSWSISVTGGGGMDKLQYRTMQKCDVLLVYLPHQNRFITLPGDFFVGSRTKSKLVPKHYL